MDRPAEFDEIRLALKIFQGNQIFCDFDCIELIMTDKKIITPVVYKVLTTMKEEEHSTVYVRPDCVKELDPDLQFTKTQDRDCAWDENELLVIEVTVLKLNKVEDLYRD